MDRTIIDIVEDEPLVDRGSLLDTIDTIFAANTDVLIIRGQEEIGKTTLLKQFVERNSKSVIKIFINAQSRWAYDEQNVLTEIYQGLLSLLNQKPDPSEPITIGSIRELYIRLSRRMKLQDKFVYFVVDGVDEIPTAEESSRKTILDLLPIGYHNFRFLISTERSVELWKRREYFVQPFSLDETVALFAGLEFSRRQIDEIKQTFRGIPGHMVAVRRIAKRYDDPEKLLEDLPKSLAEIFELEWRATLSAPEFMMDALAIIAFDRKAYSYSLLGEILNHDVNNLKEHIGKYSFIVLDQNEALNYTSESYRKFAQNKLRAKYIQVNNNLIDYLLRNPQSDDAVRNVSRHMFQAQRFDELLKYLSPAHFTTLLERSESIIAIQQKAQIGVSTASELHRYGDLLRFGVQLSSTSMVAGIDTWRTEIEARIALRDYTSAKRIAHSALLKENRFHLLVMIAKTQRELNLNIDPDVLAQIDQLYNEISFEEIGDRAQEIAADLVFVRPSLAIQAVEKASKSHAAKADLEWELARLSYDAAREQLPKEGDYRTAQVMQSRLQDPSARQFSTAAWLLLGTYSAAEAIAEVEKITTTSERLSLLRLWAKRNKRRPDSVEIIKYSLNLAISDTSYSLTAQVLLDLALPLPFIEDEVNRKTLLAMFEAQQITAERLGPTDDYINMCLILIQAECLHAKISAFSKLTDIWIHISDIPDVATRASCLARLVVALMEIDPSYVLERTERLHSIASDEFRVTIENLLKDSAAHLAAVNTVLSTLARYNNDLALEVVQKMNSQNGRDEASLIILRAICTGDLDNDQVGNSLSTYRNISSLRLRDVALHVLIRSVFEEKKAIQISDRVIVDLKDYALKIESPDLRCHAIGLIYRWLQTKERQSCAHLATDLKEKLEETWELISSAWIKTDVGFELVKLLSPIDEDFARALLSKCDSVRREQVFGVDTSISVYAASIELCVIAFSGLLFRKLDNDTDRMRFDELIAHIPCLGTQAQVWSDIAFRYFTAKRTDDCKKIISAKVNPLIDELYLVDSRMADVVLARCAPAIYCANQVFAIDYIQRLPFPYQDQAWSSIRETIIHKRNPFVSFDKPSKFDIRLSYEEIGEVIMIASKISNDGVLYSVISDVAQVVSSKINRNILSVQQKTEIIRKLDTLIRSKLPNANFIKHDGWRILALAQVERMRQSGKQAWQKILDQARGIPNIADRVATLAWLAGISWGELTRNNSELFEEAYQLVPLIPTALDRMIRLRIIADECSLSEPSIARKCLSDAMKFAVNANDDDDYAANERRKIIDLAYKMDPNWANNLASLSDADPARLRARRELKNEMSILKYKQDLIGNNDPFPSRPSNAQQDSIIEAAGRALASLNAGRIQPLDKERVQASVRFASTRPFSETYPLFALAVESMVIRYKDTAEAANYLRAIFDGAMRASELIWRVTVRTNGMIPVPARDTQPDTSSILIRAGERDKAVQFIEDWLKTQCAQYLKICDPYFSPEDLEWVRKIQAILPNLPIQILTGINHQKELGKAKDLTDSYRNYWRINLTDQPAPETEIWIVGTEKDGNFPIHDRWILSVESGLRLGTSLNGFGSRDSEISILSPAEVVARTNEVDRYFLRQVKDHQGQRIKYNFFDL